MTNFFVNDSSIISILPILGFAPDFDQEGTNLATGSTNAQNQTWPNGRHGTARHGPAAARPVKARPVKARKQYRAVPAHGPSDRPRHGTLVPRAGPRHV